MRTLTGITAAMLADNRVAYEVFVKIVIPAPVSLTVRYTSFGGGFTGSIDGGSATWTEPAGGVFVDNVSQGEQNLLALSLLRVGNLDGVFGHYVWQVGNVREWPVTVYIAWFDADTQQVLQGSFQHFKGKLDAAELGDYVSLAATPLQNVFAIKIPRRGSAATCNHVFKDTRTCQYVGIDTSCLHTRADCAARTGGTNMAHWGGYDLAPTPSTKVFWGALAVTVKDHRTGSPKPSPVPPPPNPPPLPGRGGSTVIPVPPPTAPKVAFWPGDVPVEATVPTTITGGR